MGEEIFFKTGFQPVGKTVEVIISNMQIRPVPYLFEPGLVLHLTGAVAGSGNILQAGNIPSNRA